jgi:hypothetical protein
MIIKGLDNQRQVYKYVCLIIKSLDTQVQKIHNQINQYPRKSLISYLGGIYIPHIHWVTRGTGTPKDKDEVDKREACECDG